MPLPIDKELFHWVVAVSNQPGLEWLAFLFWIITVSVIAVILAALYYYWRVARDRKFTALLALGGIATYAITAAVKWLAQRPRPHMVDMLSFPSRHASLAFLLATLIGAYLLASKPKKYDFRILGAALFFIWAILVGFSRLWLEEHWMTDVIGGAVLGIIVGILFWKCKNKIYKNLNWL